MASDIEKLRAKKEAQLKAALKKTQKKVIINGTRRKGSNNPESN